MSTKPILALEIPQRSHSCCIDATPLQPEMTYFSVLIDNGHDQLQRRDYCAHCWQQEGVGSCQDEGWTYWQGSVPPKPARRELPTDKLERALLLLKEALVQSSEETACDAFVLGLYLSHTRYIALRKEVARGDVVYGVYEVLATEEMLTIPKVELTTLDIATVQKRVAKKLRGDANEEQVPATDRRGEGAEQEHRPEEPLELPCEQVRCEAPPDASDVADGCEDVVYT